MLYIIVNICIIFVYLLVAMFCAADYILESVGILESEVKRIPEVSLFQPKDECPKLAKELN